ncbi:hypothetical protein DFJ73DRAFT_813183 [Zopfochytrium polystomum]|nr:hypothetical protein DFJ73DRAFT_813183 [Zopfochytrium polystomum]
METVVRLLDSSGVNVIDSVSAEYEDSFCLESFEDLIEQHAAVDPPGSHSFIIARVQTWDHKQPGKAFFSYYNAYHLNKILFQTQVYLGRKLIHRLHVLNPLSNTDIIGNVQYFMAENVAHVVMGDSGPQPTALSSPASEDAAGTRRDSAEPVRAPPAKSPKGRANIPSPIKTAFTPDLCTEFQHDLPPPSPRVREVESGSTFSWTLTVPIIAEVEEEDTFTVDGGLKETRPIQPTQVQAAVPSPPKLGLVTGLLRRLSTSPIHQPTPTLASPARIVEPLSSPTSPHVPIPIGTPTRNATPIPDEMLSSLIPATARSRRRKLSFANAVAAAGTPNATFEEWIGALSNQRESFGADNEMEEDYDAVPTFGGISMLGSAPDGIVLADGSVTGNKEFVRTVETDLTGPKPSDDSAALQPEAPPPEEPAPQAVPRRTEKKVVTIDAVLFATDGDYLESSRVRAVFRAHALQKEDTLLFEMPEYKGSQEPNEHLALNVGADSDREEGSRSNGSVCCALLLDERGRQGGLFRARCCFVVIVVVIAVFLLLFLTLRR